MSGVSTLYLSQPLDDHCIAVYPYEILGQTEAGQPIFADPETNTRTSVVIEYRDDYRAGLLQRRVEPLFHIDEDGRVYSKLYDQPTPAELQLMMDILDQFEEVTEPA